MSEALPSDAEEEHASAQEKVNAAIQSLARAVELLDAAGAPPELGARVQEGLDAVASYQRSSVP